MADFVQKIHYKGQAEEDIYFAKLDQQLIQELHDKQAKQAEQTKTALNKPLLLKDSEKITHSSALIDKKITKNGREIMKYRHILVAIDLTDSSEYIINKAVSLAKMSNAELSLIYVDMDYSNIYTGLSYSEFTKIEPDSQRVTSLQNELKSLAEKVDYPISHRLFESGDLSKNILQSTEELGADLLVCGHHHDFWSGLLSSSRKLLRKSVIDIFIVQV
ncbi:universal stress protein [Psychromonas sp. MME2]|uniref:universal stress protein n=1 Tax=unclassified Psychromonas TaxID=2614957 RepID=UPI00339C82DC